MLKGFSYFAKQGGQAMISGYSSTMESVAAYSAAGIQNKKTTQNQKSAESTDNTQTSGKTQNSVNPQT